MHPHAAFRLLHDVPVAVSLCVKLDQEAAGGGAGDLLAATMAAAGDFVQAEGPFPFDGTLGDGGVVVAAALFKVIEAPSLRTCYKVARAMARSISGWVGRGGALLLGRTWFDILGFAS